jgi:acyl-CoA thioesterase
MEGKEIIQHMLGKDLFSQWLGIHLLEERDGFVRLEMQTRPEMCNGFNVIHGGILYSFADSALAFASNRNGKHAVSIESSISHLKTVHAGETIFAVATRIKEGNHIAVYHVSITRATHEPIADFKGTVYRKDNVWN